ncbi:hypothetical protein AN960_05230 [Bacillus sp. FJAT-25509]|uniref:DUF3888 domain-containing protein n=1 Tax=Bacillus sp. FJAT-25509 TaxID=1712029 RepID=UPI0007012A30|nr:DUF3888 domain-containing protein [Bacillus sp. FJAT-25509]KQL41373.1 hypothetical protein AN960_05230 [Bacillus sp. FJAT-25509]
MKTKFFILISISMFIFLIQPSVIKANQNEINNKLLHDTLLTTLDPYISKGVEDYYGYQKAYGLYDAKILNINRDREGSFSFTAKVQVNTFEHAHNPPYGKETMIFHISPIGIKKISFVHEGDQEERKFKQFYSETISDIKQSFNLNLELYSEYNYSQLQYKAEKEKEYKSLTNITEEIINNILNPEVHPPYKNVISPVTFIKGKKAYILFKKSDGTNILYEVNKQNKRWEVVKKMNKNGKKMKNELLWYL